MYSCCRKDCRGKLLSGPQCCSPLSVGRRTIEVRTLLAAKCRPDRKFDHCALGNLLRKRQDMKIQMLHLCIRAPTGWRVVSLAL
mmetsp:Transcript_77648/g.137520  ORF Transcript_77648/g.137520 Transcript_77648/m.137520 type:complete len:84 (-) Transcript_77648:210-461(-)